MKKMILAIAAVVISTTAVMAQDNNASGERRQGQRPDRTEMIKTRTEEIVKKYELNPEQATKLQALNEKYGDIISPRMGGMGGMRGGRRGGGPGGAGGGAGMGQRPQGNGGQGAGQRPEMNEEMRARMEAARKETEEKRKEYNEELQKIMTPEQFKTYQADMEEQQKQMQQRRGGRRGQFGGGQFGGGQAPAQGQNM